jgi:hypothetical protein
MPTLTVDAEVRDQAQVLKENFGYDNVADFLSDAMDFIEGHSDEFEEEFEDEDEDEEEE